MIKKVKFIALSSRVLVNWVDLTVLISHYCRELLSLSQEKKSFWNICLKSHFFAKSKISPMASWCCLSAIAVPIEHLGLILLKLSKINMLFQKSSLTWWATDIYINDPSDLQTTALLFVDFTIFSDIFIFFFDTD